MLGKNDNDSPGELDERFLKQPHSAPVHVVASEMVHDLIADAIATSTISTTSLMANNATNDCSQARATLKDQEPTKHNEQPSFLERGESDLKSIVFQELDQVIQNLMSAPSSSVAIVTLDDASHLSGQSSSAVQAKEHLSSSSVFNPIVYEHDPALGTLDRKAEERTAAEQMTGTIDAIETMMYASSTIHSEEQGQEKEEHESNESFSHQHLSSSAPSFSDETLASVDPPGDMLDAVTSFLHAAIDKVEMAFDDSTSMSDMSLLTKDLMGPETTDHAPAHEQAVSASLGDDDHSCANVVSLESNLVLTAPECFVAENTKENDIAGLIEDEVNVKDISFFVDPSSSDDLEQVMPTIVDQPASSSTFPSESVSFQEGTVSKNVYDLNDNALKGEAEDDEAIGLDELSEDRADLDPSSSLNAIIADMIDLSDDEGQVRFRQCSGGSSDADTMVEPEYARHVVVSPHPEAAQPSLLEEVWLSVFTPGINDRVQLVMHGTFIVLFLSLSSLFVLSDFNLHVLFLLFIAICLYSTTVWLLANLPPVQESDVGAKKTR